VVTPEQKSGNARAIADPTRREFSANFATSRPAISKHLRMLRSVGPIATNKSGAAHICRLNAKPLRAVSVWLQDYVVFWRESLHGLKNYVEETATHKEDRR
jgi:hypothetical protein